MQLHIHINHYHHYNEDRIMNRLAEFENRFNAFADGQTQAITGLKTTAGNIRSDILGLAQEIEKLKQSAPDMSEEDQATLERMTERMDGVNAGMDDLKVGMETLDGMTPPTVPTDNGATDTNPEAGGPTEAPADVQSVADKLI